MSFPSQNPHVFSRAGIESLAEGQSGCYGLFNANGWIYVGKSGCIRTRLLTHLAGDSDNPRILRNGPTHYVTVLGESLEASLIVEYSPCCNRKVG